MLCRLCKKAHESIDHIVSGCSKFAQRDCKRIHDNLCKMLPWKLARKCNFEAGDKWYEHEPESVLENEDYYKILWDFSIQTDHVIEAWRADLTVVDKRRRSCKIILQFLEMIYRIEVSWSKKEVTEDLEFESEDYTISCGHFRCYTETVW